MPPQRLDVPMYLRGSYAPFVPRRGQAGVSGRTTALVRIYSISII